MSHPAPDEAPIRVLIVDDHPVVRDGLRGAFGHGPKFEVVGEAADGAEAVRLAQMLRPDVVLMDLRMPVMDGVAAIEELAKRGVAARVLVLTTYDTDSYVLPAVEAGATGYLLKDAPSGELLRAVRAAAHGESVLAPTVAARLLSRVRSPGQEPLSQRELEVLELVAAGSTNREAAARLFISEATVKSHLIHIYGKLGVGDRRGRGRGVQPRPADPGTPRQPRPPLAIARDGHLAEQGPVVLRDREVDDPRGVRQVRRQVPLRLLEVRGVDVRPAGLAVPEGLHQDVLVWVGDAAGPVEPQAARLVPRRLGELGGDLRPLVGVLGPDLELGRNEDHQSSCRAQRRRFVRPSSYG
jgi:DNA-binding NarL/FixJ family response regulator